MSKKKNKNQYENKQASILMAVLGGLLISALIICVMNYIWPTPWNIRSGECWIKVFLILIIVSGINCIAVAGTGKISEKKWAEELATFPFVLPMILVLAAVVGGISGTQLLNSKAYADIISVEEVTSTDEILSEEDAESIALMDTASATQLGDREIGSIENFSAFNVSDDYVQLNVSDDAVKIAPLEYAGFFKWMKNKEGGVTGYVTVSPTTMTADYVELEEGMQYVPTAYFSKDLNRHIHSQFPTLIYGNIHFEVDEEGNPYYVSSVYDKTIGLFGGEVIVGAIITDPVSGDSAYYDLAEVPGWVDDVVEADLICALYNVSHKNINGYWNGTSFGANTGCMQTTTLDAVSDESEDDDEESASVTDYGYIAKDGDIYIYTGVTSMAKDSSNLGFIMVNERTGDFRYFPVSGANEQSAMHAAEGEVQQYSYTASFPTLINVDEELTYIGVLKDNNGLVKMYYMVNVKDYGKVVVASKREECMELYADEMGLHPDQSLMDQMANAGDGDDTEEDSNQEENTSSTEPAEFTISVLQFAEVDGNTYVYMGTADGTVYRALFDKNEQLLFAEPGMSVKGTVSDGLFALETLVSGETVAQ